MKRYSIIEDCGIVQRIPDRDGDYVLYSDIGWKKNCEETPVPIRLKHSLTLVVTVDYGCCKGFAITESHVVQAILGNRNNPYYALSKGSVFPDRIIRWTEIPEVPKEER